MSDESGRALSPDEGPLPPTVEVFHADSQLALYQSASVKTLLEMLGHRPRVFGGASDQARTVLARAGLLDGLGPQNLFPRLREALTYARTRALR
ncbi:MAG: hypothetical protein ACREL3_00210 [Gemmatimonadales bacterium]